MTTAIWFFILLPKTGKVDEGFISPFVAFHIYVIGICTRVGTVRFLNLSAISLMLHCCVIVSNLLGDQQLGNSTGADLSFGTVLARELVLMDNIETPNEQPNLGFSQVRLLGQCPT